MGSHIRTAITLCGLKPGRTFSKSQKLCSNRPATIINTRDKANSVTTSARRVRACSAEPVEPRPFLLEHGNQIRTSGMQRRRQTENCARNERRAESKNQNSPV